MTSVHYATLRLVCNRINAIKKVNGNIIGTVLNGVEQSRNKYYYYYGTE